jgi:hypothetical protein
MVSQLWTTGLQAPICNLLVDPSERIRETATNLAIRYTLHASSVPLHLTCHVISGLAVIAIWRLIQHLALYQCCAP